MKFNHKSICQQNYSDDELTASTASTFFAAPPLTGSIRRGASVEGRGGRHEADRDRRQACKRVEPQTSLRLAFQG